MNDAEEAIVRVMTGLRDADPSPDFERRILQTLADRAAAPRGWRRVSGAPWLYGRALLASGLALAAVLVVLTVMPRRQYPAEQAGGQFGRPDVPTIALSGKPVQARSVVSHRLKSAAHSAPAVRPTRETEASFPAPPLPLTEQERLLLRIVHRGDPVELAILDPDARARVDAQGSAEFTQFFNPAPTGEKQ